MGKLDWLERFNKVHSNYDYSKVEYVNQYKKVKIGHKHKDGIYWFEQRPRDHWNGQGCPQCFGTPKKSTEEFKKEVEEKFPNQFNLSKVKYSTNSRKVLFGCKNHKDDIKADGDGTYWFEKTPNAFLSDIYGCPRCSPNRRMDTEDFVYFSNKVFNNFYDYSKTVYKNCRTKVVITCKEHGDFKKIPSKHLQGSGCVACNQSIGESIIQNFLIENKLVFEHPKRFDNLKDIDKLSYDFFLPNLNLLIEYNGEQHYEPIEFFGGKDFFEKQKRHDKLKKEYADKNRIELMIIPYWDFKQMEEKWLKRVLVQ